ncbi:hypothetical protein BX666DRAFT_963839 [Dichotomocladium elegans]|nr:hypothetical protein BX666DRAFT_963839 [Dichotomocladium elegans]
MLSPFHSGASMHTRKTLSACFMCKNLPQNISCKTLRRHGNAARSTTIVLLHPFPPLAHDGPQSRQSVHHEINTQIARKQHVLEEERLRCAHNYHENQCHLYTYSSLFGEYCEQWRSCMDQDTSKIERLS